MRTMMSQGGRAGKAACRSGSGLSEGLGINARCGREMRRVREGESARVAKVQPRCPRMRRPGGVRRLLVWKCRLQRPRGVSGARVCAAHGNANRSGEPQDSAIDA